jgi:class 3 adenylate cyclase
MRTSWIWRFRRNIASSITIQKAFAAHNQATSEAAMYLRIGISAGEPIEEYGDLFGSAVQLAARICAHAEPGRILVAQVVRDQYPGKAQSFCGLGEITPKGFGQAIHVYEVERVG